VFDIYAYAYCFTYLYFLSAHMPDLRPDPTPKVAIGHQLAGGANYANVMWPGMKWKYAAWQTLHKFSVKPEFYLLDFYHTSRESTPRSTAHL